MCVHVLWRKRQRNSHNGRKYLIFGFLLLINLSLVGNNNYLAHNVCYVSKYVSVSVSVIDQTDMSGELYSTLRYIGKPEKFPPQGVGTLKRDHRFPLRRNWPHAASAHAVTRSDAHHCHTAAALTCPLWVYCMYIHIKSLLTYSVDRTATYDVVDSLFIKNGVFDILTQIHCDIHTHVIHI